MKNWFDLENIIAEGIACLFILIVAFFLIGMVLYFVFQFIVEVTA